MSVLVVLFLLKKKMFTGTLWKLILRKYCPVPLGSYSYKGQNGTGQNRDPNFLSENSGLFTTNFFFCMTMTT